MRERYVYKKYSFKVEIVIVIVLHTTWDDFRDPNHITFHVESLFSKTLENS